MSDKNLEIIKAIQNTGKASTPNTQTTKLVTESYKPQNITVRTNDTTLSFFTQKDTKKKP